MLLEAVELHEAVTQLVVRVRGRTYSFDDLCGLRVCALSLKYDCRVECRGLGSLIDCGGRPRLGSIHASLNGSSNCCNTKPCKETVTATRIDSIGEEDVVEHLLNF